MTEREALLRAVCDNPDDDTPRLVYADWLQENGDEPRAEFIRLQLKLAERYTIAVNMMSGYDSEYDRAQQLEAQSGSKWMTEVPKDEGWRWEMWRGFPAKAEVDYWQKLKSLLRLIDGKQPLEYLVLKDLSPTGVRHLVEHPFLDRVRYLRLYRFGGLRSLQVLLASPRLAGLKYLGMRHCDIGDAGAQIVANSPHLAGLKLLDLSCNQIADAGVRAICRSPYLRKISFLDFERNLHSEDLEPELEDVFGDRVNG